MQLFAIIIINYYNKKQRNLLQKMTNHKKVQSLQTLSLKAVGSLVVALVPFLLDNLKPPQIHQDQVKKLHNSIILIRNHLLSHVPSYLYDKMAIEVLNSVKMLIERKKKMYDPLATITSFLTEMNVVVSLTEVVLSEYLKYLDFTAWPKIMRYVMSKCLEKMHGLEVLNLGACAGGWSTENIDKVLVNGIAKMRNLKSLCLCFDCTDNIVTILGDNCVNLQTLDVTSSRSVTDRSIPSLLKCRKLHVLQLHRTSVTVIGYAQLLLGLPYLQDLGRCDLFGNVVQLLTKMNGNEEEEDEEEELIRASFQLKKLQARDLNTQTLTLMVDLCPNLTHLSLFRSSETICDLKLLCRLDNLKDLKLLSCHFYNDHLKRIIEVRGSNLSSLHLEHVEDIDLNGLILISQYCPTLKSLVLYNCDFIDEMPNLERRFKVKPFQCLERLFWVVDCAIVHLEFVLANAINIKYIHLGSSTGITHSSIVKVLAVNQMKSLEEIRILFSSDMNMETVQLLLANCSNLRLLSELESWLGISVQELVDFKKFIYSNNYDVDIRPTLSY